MNTAILTAVIIAAISFVLQKTLGNLIYGIIMFVTRPFEKGDKVVIIQNSREIASGKVFKCTSLHIYIKQYNRDVSILPNMVLENCVIKNSDYKDGVNHTESLQFSLDSNFKKAEKIILNTLIMCPDTYNTKENTHIICKIISGNINIEKFAKILLGKM